MEIFFLLIFKAELNNSSVLNSLTFPAEPPGGEESHVSCLHLPSFSFSFELPGMLGPLRNNVFIQETQSK